MLKHKNFCENDVEKFGNLSPLSFNWNYRKHFPFYDLLLSSHYPLSPEIYSEPCQISNMERFLKEVNGLLW